MIKIKKETSHPILYFLIIVCSLFYMYLFQFAYPFPNIVFLYGAVACLAVLFVSKGILYINEQIAVFSFVFATSLIGCLYSPMKAEGIRESISFLLYFAIYVLAYNRKKLVNNMIKWIYYFALLVCITVIIQLLIPTKFNLIMKIMLRDDCYEQLMSSYEVDNAFAGIGAYTMNTAFFAAILFGQSFLNIVYHAGKPIVSGKKRNIVLITLALFTIMLTSKRGIFVSIIGAIVILVAYIYRGKNVIIKLLCGTFVAFIVLVILYHTNKYASSFIDRFISNEDFTTGRGDMYSSLWMEFKRGNVFIGNGTGATYQIFDTGAHNIYMQILYDHGILFSISLYVFLIYNYYMAFKSACPISIYVESMFLIYGTAGNPLYSNMFMIAYVFYLLYAAHWRENSESRNSYIS